MSESAACSTCPSRSSAHLEKLGLDVKGFDYVVALAGNPNTGKSTVFNAMTGLRQHTGNWPGKTVTRAEGGFGFNRERYKLVDLPGTYSLLSSSLDEEIARNFILFARPDVTVIVVDASHLERNLNLVLQVLEITDRAVVCLNLMDEARRLGVEVDHRRLARDLGVPVVPTSARFNEGLEELNAAIAEVASGRVAGKPHRVGGTSRDIRRAVGSLSKTLDELHPGLPNKDWVALRLLDGDPRIEESLCNGELDELLLEASPEIDRPADGPIVEANKKLIADASRLRWQIGQGFHQAVVETIYAEAARLADRAVTRSGAKPRFDWDRTLDRLVTSRTFGFPLMILLLGVVFWLTIAGANVPSSMLFTMLIDTVHPALKGFATQIGMPWWLDGVLIDGAYLATAWVVAVMLPPMAIFFPLFTLLEDFGYLPRVAFNLDRMFKRSGAHGKQALTMAMGYGCNAAGIVATRIIESPRERLIAIITNNFALCNGRWPTQILIASIFVGALAPPYLAGIVSASAVVAVVVLGVFLTFATSWFLSRTMLRGEVSTFSLELPPYRPPRVLQTLYTSLIDRTMIVLWRAVVFAVPAGIVMWLISNIEVSGVSIAQHAVTGLQPFGLVVGLTGVILLAYVIAIPANEIVIPTILMLTVMTTGAADGLGAGVMFELDSQVATGDLLRAGGWTLLTAVNLMLFSLVHNPCSTTIYTIWKETGSAKWTAVAALLPLVMGFSLCFFVAQVWHIVSSVVS